MEYAERVGTSVFQPLKNSLTDREEVIPQALRVLVTLLDDDVTKVAGRHEVVVQTVSRVGDDVREVEGMF